MFNLKVKVLEYCTNFHNFSTLNKTQLFSIFISLSSQFLGKLIIQKKNSFSIAKENCTEIKERQKKNLKKNQ